MDVLICNGFGVYFGMKTCEYLGNKVKLLFHSMVKLFTYTVDALSKVVGLCVSWRKIIFLR